MEKLLYQPDRTNSEFNLVMAYPAKEEFALSSLGYMWLFKIADTWGGVNTKRITNDSPKADMKYTDAIAFSMSFDFDFMGVFKILEENNIPFLTRDRGDSYPLIFAGGPVITTNPRPYDNIFDFMIIGDGEDLFKEVLKILKSNKNKKSCIDALSKVEGIYIPNKTLKVKKRTSELNEVIYTPIISDKSYFKDTFILELQRGCMNRCAFCTASYLNLPYRSYPYENIINTLELGLKYTNKIALLGAQISAHPQFNEIINYLRNKMDTGDNIELGISSLRTDAITPFLINTLVKGGQKTSTIAIESASERLRKFINKNLSNEQILNAVKISRENGLKGLKIYSMIGIPEETQDDIEEFINLANRIKAENKGFEITFSFSSFVPKPQTPFERAKREDTKSLEKKQKFLEKELAKIGIGTRFSSVKWDYWQTVISRGDSELGDFLINVYQKGGSLGAYKAAAKELGFDLSCTINGWDETTEVPWHIIENYVTTKQLCSEYQRLYKFL